MTTNKEYIYRSKLEYFGVLTVLLLLLVLLYIFHEMGPLALIIIIVIIYLPTSHNFKRMILYDSYLKIIFPISPFRKIIVVGYNDVLSVGQGIGTRYTGALLRINYRKGKRVKKIQIPFPSDEDWELIRKVFKQHNVEVLNYNI